MAEANTAWTDLGDGVRVRQSRVYRMNSVVLSHPERTLIVDPGVLPSELDDLARATRGVPATLIFTHGDWDHVLGRPWWPEAESVAHDALAAEVKADAGPIAAAARAAAEQAGERWERGFEAFRPTFEVSGLHFTRHGPWRVVYRDAFGHSGSMLSVHLPERGILIAGDMLSDIEIPTLTQPPALYRATLEALLPLAGHGAIETLIPGHGAIAHGAAAALARIEADLAYLDALERAAHEAVAAGAAREEAERTLAALEYPGKHAAYSMVEQHRGNIPLALAAAAAGPAKRRRQQQPPV